MNWNLVFKELLPIIIGIITVTASYNIPKSYIRSERKNKMKAASVWEKMWFSVCTISGCIVLSAFISYLNNTEIAVWLILTILPAIYSLVYYFEKDAKMTATERVIDNIRLNKEEQEASKHHSEF